MSSAIIQMHFAQQAFELGLAFVLVAQKPAG